MSERTRIMKESFVKAILDGVREKMERHSTRVISGIKVEQVSPSHLAVTVHYVTEEPKTYDVRVSEPCLSPPATWLADHLASPAKNPEPSAHQPARFLPSRRQ